MKKRLISNFLCFVSLLTFLGGLCCCSDDSPVEVYQKKVDNSLSGDKDQWTSISKSLDDLTSAMSNFDPNYKYTGEDNPDLVYGQFQPDEFAKVPNSDGYQGFIDLGLTKKWAVQNVGKPLSKYSKVMGFRDFFPNEKPATPTKPQEVSSAIPTNISDENQLQSLYNQIVTDYKNRLEELTRVYNDYKSAYDNYMAAYNRAIAEYKNYLFNEKYEFLQGDENYFAWGSTSIMTEGPSPMDYYNDFSGYPMELTNKSNDAATALWGEGWNTPSPIDVQELIQGCTWTVVKIGNHNGAIARGPNGKCIFFSANGSQLGGTLTDNKGSYDGYYLTNKRDGSLSMGVPSFIAFKLDCRGNSAPTLNIINYNVDVLCGYSLRAIRK